MGWKRENPPPSHKEAICEGFNRRANGLGRTEKQTCLKRPLPRNCTGLDFLNSRCRLLRSPTRAVWSRGIWSPVNWTDIAKVAAYSVPLIGATFVCKLLHERMTRGEKSVVGIVEHAEEMAI